MAYLLISQGLLRLPGVVYVRPALPFDQVLLLGQVSLVDWVEVFVGIAIFLHSVHGRRWTRRC